MDNNATVKMLPDRTNHYTALVKRLVPGDQQPFVNLMDQHVIVIHRHSGNKEPNEDSKDEGGSQLAHNMDDWAERNCVFFYHEHKTNLPFKYASLLAFFENLCEIKTNWMEREDYGKFVCIPSGASFTPYVEDWETLCSWLEWNLRMTLITISLDGKYFVPLRRVGSANLKEAIQYACDFREISMPILRIE